jgi:hypothetical protein
MRRGEGGHTESAALRTHHIRGALDEQGADYVQLLERLHSPEYERHVRVLVLYARSVSLSSLENEHACAPHA